MKSRIVVLVSLLFCGVVSALIFLKNSDENPIEKSPVESVKQISPSISNLEGSNFQETLIRAGTTLGESGVARVSLEFWKVNFPKIGSEFRNVRDPLKGIVSIGNIPDALSENILELPDIDAEIGNGDILGVGTCPPDSVLLTELVDAYGGALVDDFSNHFRELTGLLSSEKTPPTSDLFFYRVFTQQKWVLHDIVEVKLDELDNPLQVGGCLELCQSENPVARAVGVELARIFLASRIPNDDLAPVFTAFVGETNPAVINELLILSDLIRSKDALLALHSLNPSDNESTSQVLKIIEIIEN